MQQFRPKGEMYSITWLNNLAELMGARIILRGRKDTERPHRRYRLSILGPTDTTAALLAQVVIAAEKSGHDMKDVRKMFPKVVERGLRAQHKNADALASEVDRDDEARIKGVEKGEQLGAAGGRAPEAGSGGEDLLEAFEEEVDWGSDDAAEAAEAEEIREAQATAAAEAEAEEAAAAEAVDVISADPAAAEEAQAAAEEPQEEPPLPPQTTPSPSLTAEDEAAAEEEPTLARRPLPPAPPTAPRPVYPPFARFLCAARKAVNDIPHVTPFHDVATLEEHRHTAAADCHWWEQNWQTTLPSLRDNPTAEQALRLVASSSHMQQPCSAHRPCGEKAHEAQVAAAHPERHTTAPHELQILRLASPSWRATAIP